MSQTRSLKVLLAILALVICTGTPLAAVTLTSSISTLPLTCDTLAGPTAVSVGIKLATAGASAQNVTVTAATGLAVASGGPLVMPSTTVLSVNVNTFTNFSFTIAAGCKGTVPGSPLSLTFNPTTPSTGGQITVPVTFAITTSNGSALSPSPSSVTFTCNKTSSTVTGAQTVNVYSAATLGTPFTVPAGAPNSLPSWLTVTPVLGGTAGASAIALTATATTGCTALAASTTYTVHLVNAPAADKTFQITVVVGTTSTLAATPTSVALAYTIPAGSPTYTPGTSTVAQTTPAVYFQVNQSTVPSWLTVSPLNGTTSAPVPLTFTPNSGVGALHVGNYSASIHLIVSGQLDAVIPVTIQVNNTAATLAIMQTATQTVNWVLGSALPTFQVTPFSSDAPIAYTVTSSGVGAGLADLSPIPSSWTGLAYSFGSPITVTFPPAVFGAMAPGTTHTGTLTITPSGGGNPVVATFHVNVQPQSALINSVSPSALPTATSGTYTVVINGSGFVTGGSQTVTGVVTSSPGIIVSDSNVVASIQSSTSIVVVITVPSTSDIYLPFSGNGGTVTIGVCNPLNGGSVCATPTGTGTVTIGINPIVSAVTSSSSYVEATPPALPTVAPFDILSVFGTNFCTSAGTGCVPGGASQYLYAATSATTFGYPSSLTPDAAGAANPRNLVVTFYPHGNTTTPLAVAPLLFASNTQINLMAPSALRTKFGSVVDIIVTFGYGTGATMLTSQPYSVNVASTDPGIFTMGGDGEGNVAALASQSYALIGQAAPAIARSTALGADSDTILLYVTGLGVPDSALSGGGLSATCMSEAAYWANVNTATTGTLTSNDGLVMMPAFYAASAMEPCFLVGGSNLPSVAIGGQPANVLWAGWVQGAVAGLYQINVQLPSSTPTLPGGSAAFTYASDSPASTTMGAVAVHLPVVVTTAGPKSSQAGANLWVEQGLLATVTGATSGPTGPPSAPVYTVSGPNGTPIATTTLVGTLGNGTYTYAVSSNSSLPADLSLSTTIGATNGQITGTPGVDMVGTTSVEFTVTDGNSLVGIVTINFVIS
jgi:uncharacterized protein (TIGR03437 family)